MANSSGSNNNDDNDKSCAIFFLLELLKLTELVAMATCTNGTCQTSYCEQPVSKIDIPVN